MGSLPEAPCVPPPYAWDSHLHVVDEDVFPLHPNHPYRPKRANLDDLRTFHADLGIAHSCLVAFSVYQDDNSSLVHALSQLQGQGRAVACINPDSISDKDMQTLQDAGVRGIRINLKTEGKTINFQLLSAAADRIRPYGWALQLYVALEQIVELAPTLERLRVPVIFDHIGSPDPETPIQSQRGYSEFMELLRSSSGQVWTKLSGTYRFPDVPGLDDYVVDVLRAAPDRVVWATDWPHSSGVKANPNGDRKQLQEYRKVNDQAWVDKTWEYCRRAGGDDGTELARKIWVENPRRLWQYDRDD